MPEKPREGTIFAIVYWTSVPGGTIRPDYEEWIEPEKAIEKFGEPTHKNKDEWVWY